MARSRSSRTPLPLARPADSAPEVVDPRWLLRAFAFVLGAAAVLAYLSVCLLVFQGSWQFLFKPSSAVTPDPGSAGIAFEAIRFDSGSTGQPRLTGWWIPAAAAPAASSAPTILFLHGAQGSLPDTLRQLTLLHQAGANLFAIDYRGFGASEAAHPNEVRMAQDAAAALTWLVETRKVTPGSIVPCGTGFGASLAAQIALANPALPAVIVDNPDLATIPGLLADRRASLLPMRLLVRDRFDLATSLGSFARPRLLVIGGPGDSKPQYDQLNRTFFQSVPTPRWLVELPAPGPGDAADCESCPGPAYVSVVRRFLGENVPRSSSSTTNP